MSISRPWRARRAAGATPEDADSLVAPSRAEAAPAPFCCGGDCRRDDDHHRHGDYVASCAQDDVAMTRKQADMRLPMPPLQPTRVEDA